MEGTVTSLVEDKNGTVIGVIYKDKESKCNKVFWAINVEHTFIIFV